MAWCTNIQPNPTIIATVAQIEGNPPRLPMMNPSVHISHSEGMWDDDAIPIITDKHPNIQGATKIIAGNMIEQIMPFLHSCLGILYISTSGSFFMSLKPFVS